MARELPTCKVKLYAKFYENGKVVSFINSTSLRSFKARVTGRKFEEIDVKIVYRPDEYKDDPLFNSGKFGDLSSALQFIEECTEKPLLAHIAGGDW